MIEPLIP